MQSRPPTDAGHMVVSPPLKKVFDARSRLPYIQRVIWKVSVRTARSQRPSPIEG